MASTYSRGEYETYRDRHDTEAPGGVGRNACRFYFALTKDPRHYYLCIAVVVSYHCLLRHCPTDIYIHLLESISDYYYGASEAPREMADTSVATVEPGLGKLRDCPVTVTTPQQVSEVKRALITRGARPLPFSLPRSPSRGRHRIASEKNTPGEEDLSPFPAQPRRIRIPASLAVPTDPPIPLLQCCVPSRSTGKTEAKEKKK